jgi:hypothetical protein
LFRNTLQDIFTNQAFAIMPLNTTMEVSSAYELVQNRGTHWVGIVFRPTQENQMTVEFIDSSGNANENILACMQEEIISVIEGIQQATRADEILENTEEQTIVTTIIGAFSLRFEVFHTQQQAIDLDCGPWTVDNLVQRSHGLAINSNQTIVGGGATLRNNHCGAATSNYRRCTL